MEVSALRSTTAQTDHSATGPFAMTVNALRSRRRQAIDLYSSRLLVIDAVLVAVAAITAYAVVFGSAGQVLVMGQSEIDYVWVTLAVALLWIVSLTVSGSRNTRLVGSGSVEYGRVINSSILVLGVIAVFTLGTQVEFSRGFVFVNLPLSLLLLLLGRAGARRWLAAQRRAGRYCSDVVVVGSASAVTAVTRDLRANPTAGFRVRGACLPSGHQPTVLGVGDLPVTIGVEDVPQILRECGADTVLVTNCHDLSPFQLRELSWSLESGRYNLLLAPSLTDIAGPRVHARPVAGLPLIHVETPEHTGLGQVGKRMFDFVASAALILITSPLWLMVILGMRLGDSGDIFYRQERIGQDGRAFRMVKFRTMVPDADSRLAALLASEGLGDTPLFKLADDPRITPIGRVMRRYSIDELPQLLNVFKGEMSLVGPRPQVGAEVALYDNAAQRRLIAKPGMTGLWQVSGRSRLTWDEAVRLDLYYLENWSMAVDLVILLRTVRAVIRPGADAS
ncbi:MAG: sugar transferase [Ornithinimicrobium sp.]